MADAGFDTNNDPCRAGEELFRDTSNFVYTSKDLTTITGYDSGSVIQPNLTRFLGNVSYLVFRKNNQDTIYRLDMSITNKALTTGNLIPIHNAGAIIVTLAAFELNGFIYTKENVMGYWVLKLA